MATILIVDDRPTNRELLVTLLGYRKHRMLEAADGDEALKVMRAEHPDLIISDILMPTMDGFELVRRIRAEPALAAIKVIFYTAHYLQYEARGLAAACGVTQVLTKPVEPEVIYQAVDALLGVSPAAVEPAPHPEFDREHLSLITNKLSEQTDRLRATNGRLNAMIELAQQMATERNVYRLVLSFCCAAREIIGAKFAAIGIVNQGHVSTFLTSGVDPRTTELLGPPDPKAEVITKLLAKRTCQSLSDLKGDPLAVGLPLNFPAVHSYLGATISSLKKIYGWVCLVDKLGNDRFTIEDEQLVMTLASQLGRIYENGSLYGDLEQKVAELDREIAERKRTEKELRDSEERFKQIAETISEVFWISDIRTEEIFYISPAYEKIWGRTCKSLYTSPRSFLEAIHPDDRPKVVAALARQSQGETYHSEYRVIRPDGSVRWVFDRGYPVRNEAGEVIRVAGLAEDITESKRVLDELRESERRYQDMLSNVDLVSLMLDAEARVTYCNEYLLRLTGWKREEVIGHDWFSLFIPAGEHPRLKNLFMSLMVASPEATHHENEIISRSGERRMIRWNNSWLRSADGKVIGTASIGEDITERKALEKQLRQAQKMEAIGQLAGGVAHDFNNLLMVINGHSQLIMNRLPPGDRTRKELDLIYKSGERAAGLTRQLLAFSRQQVMQPRVLDLNSIARDLEKMLQRLIREDIELKTVLDSDLKPVIADPSQVEQVLINLVVNARDAMPNGGKVIIETCNRELDEGYAKSRDVKPGSYAMVAVSDSGTGMDEHVKAHLFEPFFTTKAPGKGTGLGLSTVYGIAKQSGGHVEVESELGKGSTFKIYLPHSDNAVATAPSSGTMPAIPAGSETILVVEDEPDVRDLLSNLLEMNGYTVLTAGNGREALAILKKMKGPVHLLITDVIMPEMGGPELAAAVKAHFPSIRTLFTSGYTDHSVVRSNGELEPGVQFLQKPFTATGLARKVREVMEGPPQP